MTRKSPEILRQNHEEFTLLFGECADWLFGYLLSLLLDSADAEDALQETSRVCWEKLDQYDRGMPFRAWARRIAYFEALKILSYRRSRGILCSEQFLEIISSKAAAMADQLDERRAALEGCLSRLPEKDRDLIDQRYAFDISTHELAEGQGRSVHAVYRSLRRVHEMLQRCINRSLAEK